MGPRRERCCFRLTQVEIPERLQSRVYAPVMQLNFAMELSLVLRLMQAKPLVLVFPCTQRVKRQMALVVLAAGAEGRLLPHQHFPPALAPSL